MNSVNLSELKNSMPLIFMFLLIIIFTANHDEHYFFRIKIHSRLRKLFFGLVKKGSVPLVTFATVIQMYVTLPTVIIIRLKSTSFNLLDLLIRFLFTPWLFIAFAIVLLEVLTKVKNQLNNKQKEKLQKQIYTEKKHEKSKKHKRR